MRPFLKWAGNKYRLIDRIREVLPPGQRLIEPFVGSGAVFLNTDYAGYILADANPDLIHLYRLIRDEGDLFIEEARTFFASGTNDGCIYYARREEFNALGVTPEAIRRKALLFIYLNRHCFNGLCRYNRKGKFNVPFGRYTRPYFPAAEMREFHTRAQNVRFLHDDFAAVMEQARPGDVVYCDPPYVPLSETARFTSYSADKFGLAQQLRLARKAEELARRGIPVVISNHHTDFIRRAYAVANLTTFDVPRRISCNAATRRPAKEVLALFC
ncbi:MAG: Dam family site-specific DNA-(adenine-N6)-methyltransferase [Caldilineaceae bacterium]|nr:Dam family site-specific DNA-(adenine-N6)-methyltransferase [Caldilineaceae bacterium]